MSADLRLDKLLLAYDGRAALNDLSGRFSAGSLTAIVGPNGAGKSTLLKAMAGVLKPSQGSLDLGGLDSRALGYLPQIANLERSFPLTVADAVAMGAWASLGAFGGMSRAQAARAQACLAAVGLPGFERYSISMLSAGQLQRVLFARLLLQDAPVLLLDEPFTGVDARTTEDLLRLIQGWHREGRTVIAVLHDLEQVRAHFPTTLLLAGRAVAWGPTVQVLTDENLRHARALAAAATERQTFADPLRAA
ncbi:metal ABC transporter ATP-binding protein [Pseudomonas sp. DC3000-4b1]|uniref:metal ABC transporter ATP-binding protein n=1 Tax=unclassified Pseudomonas TaxID=196821 RepID=UPI003CED03FD